ncbi:MAG: acyl-CoA dehydrogenase family protein, partial [Pseudomonadota bacterium]|nr:acyl-CoA dehydrogenase family protein [Pseudomonadota bacterium]
MLDAITTASAPPPYDDARGAEDAIVGALLRSVNAFCARHVDARGIDARAHVDRAVLDGLAEMGLFGLSIPESHGGYELSLGAVGEVVAGLARHDRAIATCVGLHLGLGTRGLVAFGTDALKDAWLPALAVGASIAAFATTESGAGSDLGAIRTRGVEDAGRLRLDGEKIFVTNGGIADVFTITAATPDLGGRRRGHSLVLLAREDGLVTGAEEHKLGLRGSSTTSLHLDGVVVGMDRILGTPGEGMGHLAHVLAWGRAVMAAGCRGTVRAALDATVAHVVTRRQFGKALASMDVVRAQLASMQAHEYAMTALVRHASAQRDPTALAVLSGSAKVFATEATWEIVDRALQLHGGPGYIEETGIALLLRDSRVTRIFEGANDVLRVHRGLVEATQPLPRVLVGRGASP